MSTDIDPKIQSNAESFKDIKYSWILFKHNIKAYLMTELFAVISLILAVILVLVTLVALNQDIQLLTIGTAFSVIILFVIFNIFLTSQFGLSYDILSSGDGFAEFKGSFTYFRNHWFNYLTYIIIFNLFRPRSYFPSYEYANQFSYSPYYYLRGGIIDFIWFSFMIGILPGITKHNSFRRAAYENFALLKKIPFRVLKTWFIFYLLFDIPSMFVHYFIISPKTSTEFPNLTVFIFVIVVMAMELIRFPMSSLVATRIYNLREDLKELKGESE